MIVLCADTAAAPVRARRALCVRHKSYEAPNSCRNIVLWDDFQGSWKSQLHGFDTLVVVGLSRIITPSNRVKVGQVLMRPIDGVRRISVDRTMFISEPWRLFWHFSCIRQPYQELTDSYLAETRYKQSLDGFREDPFSLAEIKAYSDGKIQAHGHPFFESFEVTRVPVSQEWHRRYAAEKASAFDEEHTPSAIIKRLEAVSREALKDRKIPTPSRLFANRHPVAIQSDLKVDDFLVGRLRYLVELTNGIHEAFQPRA